MQAGEQPGPAGQVGADAAHGHDMGHAGGSHRGDDRFPDARHVGVHIGHFRCARQQHVRGVGTAKGLGERGGVAGVDCDDLGAGVAQGGQAVRGSAERPDVLTGFEQAQGGGSAGVPCGPHDGDHLHHPPVSRLFCIQLWS